ncbi:hypothetical protein [Bacillus sp. AFS031507]|uniref:hypothetical protein n=1 Tax=Bacillus sp. AFS031507 TaxID=2033496 RepID=UPI000BFC7B53|nr:hypothetical protein [Bacillus sp. AFS031507]PGY05376.1 hypothetical protein COE25_28915 [Bacillus sp. AFS031507]
MTTKKEIYLLMKLIEVYFEQFKITQEKLDCWHVVLSKYSYEKLHGNLMVFVVHSPHPPKISDLVQNSSGGARAIPGQFVLDLTAGEDW